MIYPITKKEYKRVKSLRKHSKDYMAGRLYFIALDGKAYFSDQTAGSGLKEIVELNKRIKADLTAQTELI